MNTRTIPTIEALEARIAPAAVFSPDGRTATFTDVDGDLVTVKVSKGTLDASNFQFEAKGMGDELKVVKFGGANGEFDNADLSIMAAPKAGVGDGFVNVGWVESTGHPLGKVTVDGDLERLTAFSDTGLSIKSLLVRS